MLLLPARLLPAWFLSPGPCRCRCRRHKVERLLEGVDAVLYLLDYTKLKSRWAGARRA